MATKFELDRGGKFKRYGWTLSEVNLNTLPEDAPEGAKDLAEWLIVEGRRRSLMEWFSHLNDKDGRIHGRFTHIGAWTGRMAHSKPNQANIPAGFHGKPSNAVEEAKARYDHRLRALWTVEEGNYLVGTDAEGIQLRILAHLMKSPEYIEAIVSGDKDNGTDIHNLNRKALGMPHITRDMAKTFIYAFLLGAGNAKIAEILQVSAKDAEASVKRFMESITGLSNLKNNIIPRIAAKGFFVGLDGRKVPVPSQHKALAGMLQNGESVLMKHAALGWVAKAREQGFNFKLVTWPHDEWQTEVEGTLQDAEALGKLQVQSIVDAGVALNLRCPMDGSTDIGRNWQETH